MKSFKRFMSEAETRVGSSIFKLSKAEMKELRRIVKKSGSKVLSVASLAARPNVARDMIRKHGNASVLEERQVPRKERLARFHAAQGKADRITTLTRMLKSPKTARFAAAQMKADRMSARNEEREPKFGNKVEAAKAIRALETKLSSAGGSKRKELQQRIDSLRKQSGIKEQTLNESLMRVEFKTEAGAKAFAQEFDASSLTGRVTRGPRKMGSSPAFYDVEFLARPAQAKEISKLAKKNKGTLTFMG